MKIEILEQAIASYLRNVEGARIVQNNWEPSPAEIDSVINDSVKQQRIRDMMSVAQSASSYPNLFKNVSPDTMLRQAELDVVGLKFGKNNSVYLYDTAFHKNGLNYKGGASKVVQKFVRAFIIGDIFFPGYYIFAGFVSPVCRRVLSDQIIQDLNNVAIALSKFNQNIFMRFFDQNSCKLMLSKLITMRSNISNDNDLFLRAADLLSAFSLICDTSNVSSSASRSCASNVANISNKSNNKAVIMDSIAAAMQSGKLTQAIINNLEDKTWCKANLGLNFPFLIETKILNAKDKKRFYKDMIVLNSNSYYVCSQWYKDSIDKFKSWYKTI